MIEVIHIKLILDPYDKLRGEREKKVKSENKGIKSTERDSTVCPCKVTVDIHREKSSCKRSRQTQVIFSYKVGYSR